LSEYKLRTPTFLLKLRDLDKLIGKTNSNCEFTRHYKVDIKEIKEEDQMNLQELSETGRQELYICDKTGMQLNIDVKAEAEIEDCSKQSGSSEIKLKKILFL
jgi:hypothetical protein